MQTSDILNLLLKLDRHGNTGCWTVVGCREDGHFDVLNQTTSATNMGDVLDDISPKAIAGYDWFAVISETKEWPMWITSVVQEMNSEAFFTWIQSIYPSPEDFDGALDKRFCVAVELNTAKTYLGSHIENTDPMVVMLKEGIGAGGDKQALEAAVASLMYRFLNMANPDDVPSLDEQALIVAELKAQHAQKENNRGK